MHFVYIIFSQQADHYYVGEPAFPDGRLKEHNSGKYFKASTKKGKDWIIMLLIKCKDRSGAIKIERYIKEMKSRKFIESLIQDKEFRLKFIQIVKEKLGINIIG
jgi:putative endonuclease